MSRGDRRENVYLDDVDRQDFLKTLAEACQNYVHLNPVRAGLLGSEERLLSYPWSSFPGYLAASAHRPVWLRVERLLGQHGIAADTAAGRQELEQRMERRRGEETAGSICARKVISTLPSCHGACVFAAIDGGPRDEVASGES